jgi:branched-chain amino acid transport system permease protein
LAGAIIVTFLPEVMRIDPVDSRIAYGLALIAVVMLLPGGVIAAVGRGYQWATRAVRGPRANADPADPGASWT